jgi:hypothetical protein
MAPDCSFYAAEKSMTSARSIFGERQLVDALMRISYRTESDTARGITSENNTHGFRPMMLRYRLVGIRS